MNNNIRTTMLLRQVHDWVLKGTYSLKTQKDTPKQTEDKINNPPSTATDSNRLEMSFTWVGAALVRGVLLHAATATDTNHFIPIYTTVAGNDNVIAVLVYGGCNC